MVAASILVGVQVGSSWSSVQENCRESFDYYSYCNITSDERFAKVSGGFGGFNRSLTL
jgi:hypothetical protein